MFKEENSIREIVINKYDIYIRDNIILTSNIQLDSAWSTSDIIKSVKDKYIAVEKDSRINIWNNGTIICRYAL